LNFIILAVIIIIILENAVALIQSYVFTILSSLYLSETNRVKNYLNNFLTQSIITKK